MLDLGYLLVHLLICLHHIPIRLPPPELMGQRNIFVTFSKCPESLCEDEQVSQDVFCVRFILGDVNYSGSAPEKCGSLQ